MNQGGFPHSEISGSKPVCGSPELIAAYHVLHRLLAPRHSPYALSSLTIRTQYRAAFSWLLAVGSALFRARCPLPATRCRLHISESTACALVRNYRLQDIQLSKNGGTVFGAPFKLSSAFARLRANALRRASARLHQPSRPAGSPTRLPSRSSVFCLAPPSEGQWRIPGSNR